MYTLETLDGALVRCVNGVPQVNRNGLLRSASPRYRTTDPYEIMRKLADDGLAVTTVKRRSPDWHALEIMDPARPEFLDRAGGAQKALAKVLLAHTGRHSLILSFGALRCACHNQFMAPYLKIHHTDSECGNFINNPAWYVRQCLTQAPIMTDKIDRLREEPLLADYTAISGGLADLGPMVRRRFEGALDAYCRLYGPSVWSLAQACTYRTRDGNPLRKAGMAVVMADPNTEARLEAWRDALVN